MGRRRKCFPHQILRHVGGGAVEDVVSGDARLDVFEERVAIRHDILVQRRLGRGVRPVHRPDARDVARVVAVVGGIVHQHQVAVAQRVGLAKVMPQKRVRAATNDRGVAIAAGAARIEHIFGGRIELILVHAGSSGAHRFHDAESCEFRRLANERDLGGALDHPQTIQRGCQIAHYELREALMHESHEMRLARRSAIPRITGRARLSGQQFVATVVAGLHGAERRVQRQGRRAYEVGADEIQGEALQSLHLSDPGEPCHEGRVLHRQNLPLRAFAPRVAMREIQGGRAGATVQQQVGMRRLDAA